MKSPSLILVHAPFNNLSMPLLSLATLKGYLKSKGIDRVVCLDTNLEFFQTEMTADNLQRRGREILPFMSNQAKQTEILDWVCRHLADSIQVFKNWNQFLNIGTYLRAVRVLKKSEDLLDHWDIFLEKRTPLIKKPKTYLSLDLIDESVRKYYLRLRRYFDKRIDSFSTIDIAGFSIVFVEQLLPSYVMAARLKRKFPRVHVVFGGPIVSRFFEAIRKEPRFFKYVNSYVALEGEVPLESIYHQIQDTGEITAAIPNVLTMNHRSRIQGDLRAAPAEDTASPLADFSDYDLDGYLVPERALPIIATSNCYWGKCTFCAHIIGRSRYTIQPVEKMVQAIDHYQKNYHVRYFYFTDNSLRPSFLKNFSERIIQNKLDIRYYGDCRPCDSLSGRDLKTIRKSGCISLYVGIESASDRLHGLIGKGLNVSSILRFVKNCHAARIGLKFNTFIGFPTETRKEAQATLEMIKSYRMDADMLALSRFVLEKDVEIFNNPRKFEILITEPFNPEADDDLLYHFHQRRGINEKTATRLIDAFFSRNKNSICRRRDILYRDHHTFFLSEATKSWFSQYRGPSTSQKFRRIGPTAVIQTDENVIVFSANDSHTSMFIQNLALDTTLKVTPDVADLLTLGGKPVFCRDVIGQIAGERKLSRKSCQRQIMPILSQLLKLEFLRSDRFQKAEFG